MSANLSPREIELLKGSARLTDTSDKRIAQEFGLSIKTVQTHFRNIHRKLNVQTRTAALLLFCRQNGWLRIPAGALCVLLAGCTGLKSGPPPEWQSLPQASLDSAHRAAWLADGGTITNWNGGEHWVAKGARFKPRKLPQLPPMPIVMGRSVAANSFEAAVEARLNSSTHIDTLTAPVLTTGPSLAMPHIPAIVYARQTLDGPDLGEWQHDPAVYSANVMVDPGSNGAPSLFLHWSIPQN